MNQYLLLRDNKQTGPYTAADLAAKGLKPYDLVWQEGRSAAWRYPGELEELKPFAPVVEEQPYDRFYKKPGEQQASASGQSTTEQQVTAIPETQLVTKPVELSNAKHIHVTLPGGKVPVVKKEETAKTVVAQNDRNVASANTKNTENKAAAASYIISQEDDELNSSMLKGFQSKKKEGDQVNNGFLSEYESRKSAWSQQKQSTGATEKEKEQPVAVAATSTASIKQTSSHSTWSTPRKEAFDLKGLLAGSSRYLQDNKNVMRGLVAAVLILGGVVIGLIINSGRRQPDTQALESLVKEIRDQQNEKSSAPAPLVEEKTTTRKSELREEEPVNNDNGINNIADPAPSSSVPVNNHQPVQPSTRQTIIRKDNSVLPPPPNQNKSIVVSVSNPSTQPAEPMPTVIEPKEKPINQEVLEKARKNIYEQVQVEASAFKVGILGGVSDLDITIKNSSLYSLDQVAVEIKYYGMEKKLVKTQTLVFNNVPPGKRRTLEAPRTSRGITIEYTVTSINSKALGLASAGF